MLDVHSEAATQVPSMHICPRGQSASETHSGLASHAPFIQAYPAGQSTSPPQAGWTHCLFSHTSMPGQSASFRHSGGISTHVPFSQTRPSGQSRSLAHLPGTHLPSMQNSPSEQSMSVVHSGCGGLQRPFSQTRSPGQSVSALHASGLQRMCPSPMSAHTHPSSQSESVRHISGRLRPQADSNKRPPASTSPLAHLITFISALLVQNRQSSHRR